MAGSPLSAPREYRFRWYLQVEKYHKSVREVCQIFGISRKTYYKWFQRDHGPSDHTYHQRQIHPQTKITPRLRVVIVDAKQKYNYGPQRMSLYLAQQQGVTVSHQAIYKFFKRKRLIRKPRKKQSWYTPLKEPYYASQAGENVQLDVKYVPSPRGQWHYQYRFLDTVTNLQYAVNMEYKDARATIAALGGAQRSLPFPISGIQTDNGAEFRGVFHEYLRKRQIIHRYIPKRSAPWNGQVERANRSVDDEFYLNPGRPWKHLYQYTKWYNYERPHTGKGMKGLTPYQKFLSLSLKKCHP